MVLQQSPPVKGSSKACCQRRKTQKRLTVVPNNYNSKSDQELLELLYTRLNNPPHTKWNDTMKGIPGNKPVKDPLAIPMGDLPPVAPAPAFRKQTPAVGGELSQTMEKFYRIAPELRGRVGKLGFGPNLDVVDEFVESSKDKTINPLNYEDTNLLGLANKRTGNVSLNPILSQRVPFGKIDDHIDKQYRNRRDPILGHELAHVMGDDEQAANHVNDIIQLLIERGIWDKQ